MAESPSPGSTSDLVGDVFRVAAANWLVAYFVHSLAFSAGIAAAECALVGAAIVGNNMQLRAEYQREADYQTRWQMSKEDIRTHHSQEPVKPLPAPQSLSTDAKWTLIVAVATAMIGAAATIFASR